MSQAANAAKRAYLYMTPGIITGVSIGAINTANIRKSPEYHQGIDFIDYTRFSSCIAVKSCVYGTFYPFVWVGMLFSVAGNNRPELERHYIPFSRYGQTR